MITWPLLGNLPAFYQDTPGFLLRIKREQGDIAGFRLGRTDAVLLSHPDLIQIVLIERAGEFTKGRLMQRARRLLGDGLLTSEGDVHRAQRRRIQPAFTRDRVRQYGALASTLAAMHVAQWQANTLVRVDTEMDRVAMRVVAGALFGSDLQDQLPSLGEALRLLAHWAPVLSLPGASFLERSKLPWLGQVRAALDLLDAVIERQIIADRSESALLGVLRDEAPPVAPRMVRDEVMTIFLAGHDTTAATLTWIWLLLATHPDAELRLRAELATVLDGREPRPDDLDSLAYTDMVVREALRLYPPIGRIGRRPRQDIELEDVVLRQNMPVFLSPYVTQRDERWFEEPEAFRPERWAQPASSRPRLTWFPFGAGPRSCIGEYFARTVLPLIVAAVAQRWRLRASSRHLPPHRSLLTMKPRGAVWMLAEPVPRRQS